MHHMQEWDVLAEEPLDAVLEPESDTNANPEDNLSDACITWRGDGKHFATVSACGQGQKFDSTIYLHACVNMVYITTGPHPFATSPVHGGNRNPLSSHLVKSDEGGAGNNAQSPHVLQTTCMTYIAWFEHASKMATSISL